MGNNLIFYFSFKGLALGGKAIIAAPSESEAREMLKEIQPFDDEPMLDKIVAPSHNKQILHFWNGDY